MATEEKIIDGEAVEVNSTPVEENATSNENAAQAQQNEQPKEDKKPEKKKRHMPKWLKATLTHLGAAGLGAGVTVLIGHLLGKDAGDVTSSVTTQAVQSQPQISSAPQQAIGQIAVDTINTVAESAQNQ